MSLHTHTWEADATKLNSQIPPRATLHPLPRPPRYLFKAKMDLGSGQHMPQKQAYQPQNHDKPRAVNVWKFPGNVEKFQIVEIFQNDLASFMENMLVKMFTYKDKIFLHMGPGYLCF